MSSQTGIVGFFDILGYQNLLEKNEPEEIAETVIPFLTGILPEITDKLKEYIALGAAKAGHKSIIDSIKWLVFSDTILLTIPIQESEEDVRWVKWTNFFAVCMSMQRKMFEKGLPLRGAINYGKFYIKDTCFAGRAIIEAYQLCNQLEFAACVLTESCRPEIKKITGQIKQEALYNYFVHDYLVPKKDGELQMLTLASHTYDGKKEDMTTQVLEAFWGHNKDIPIHVQKKIASTDQWLRFLRLKIAKAKKD
jgi:hypothetical protein